MMNKKQISLEKKYNLFKGMGYILLLVILTYGLIIFCYDNFLSLFHWINYSFIERTIPSIFIPNLGDNGSYEKRIILGLITLIITIIIPISCFINSLYLKIKYTKDFMVEDKRDPLMKMQVKLSGNPNRTVTLIEMLIIFPIMYFAFLWIGSKTNAWTEVGLFEIFLFYITFMALLSCIGLFLALLIFKIFYQDILK